MGKLSHFVVAVAVVSLAVADPTDKDDQDGGNSRCPEAFENFRQAVVNYTGKVLHSLIQASARDDTYLASPVVALGLVAQNAYFAEEETLAEALKLLGLSNKEDIPCVLQQLTGMVSNQPEGVNYIYSSNVVADNGYKFKQNYVNELYNDSWTDAFNCNYSQPGQVRRRINNKIASDTNGKVLNLIQSSAQINTNTEFSVFVGQYFESEFDVAFNTDNITIGNYYKRPNTVIKTRYLYVRGVYDYFYCKDLKTQFIRMPFKDDFFEELLMIPVEKDGYKLLAEQLASDGGILELVYNSMRPAMCGIKLPIFINATKTVNSRNLLMQNSNMKTFYDSETACFKNITEGDKPVGLEQFCQKIVLRNNLQGGQHQDDCGCSGGMEDMNEYEIIVDRPVLVYILKQRFPLFCLVGKVGEA